VRASATTAGARDHFPALFERDYEAMITAIVASEIIASISPLLLREHFLSKTRQK